MSTDRAPLLTVEELSVRFDTAEGALAAVQGVRFELASGQTLGVVGESGSGKTLMVRALIGLAGTARVSGRVVLDGQDLLRLSEERARTVRGKRIAMVLQNPLGSLNPVMTVGRQIAEPLRHHLRLSRNHARARAVELLRDVGISDPARTAGSYPIQLSGGMQQRVMIAIALSCSPDVLIADEPTTALDVTVQAQILDLLGKLQANRDMALILVSHDLGLIAEHADHLLVMYAGVVVESGPTAAVLERPRFPYTAGLLAASPTLEGPRQLPLPIPGAPPSRADRLAPCPFMPRCTRSVAECATTRPPAVTAEDGHAWGCWNPLTMVGEAR